MSASITRDLVARLVPTLALLVLCAGAREQCIPGPFEYDDENQTGDNGPIGPDANCFDPNCPDFACTNDGECQNFFGPDATCESGTCRVRQSCPLGQDGSFCQSADESCAFDPTSQNPFNDGVCLPASPTPAALGASCSTDVTDVNPCGGGGAFCMPVEASQGICVEGCDGDGVCANGFNCSAPFVQVGGGRAVCLAECNLDAPDCGGDPRFVCAQAQAFGGGSCTPDNGACVLAGCDDNGCDPLCTSGEDCVDGTFCIEKTVTNCRADGPDQTFSVCAPPAQQNEACALTEPSSCANGLACLPFGFEGPTCAQQSATTTSDGGTCNPNDPIVNRCEPGAYCAGDGGTGICQRFCREESECEPGFGCARANLGGGGPSGSDFLAGVRVCAEECNDDADCPAGLECDRDAGTSCNGPGFCVPPEDGQFCASDAECTSGRTCSDSRCVRPEDVCEAQVCELVDPGSCAAGFACSPFNSPVPICVPQNATVLADGDPCNPNDVSTTQCAQGSVCAGTCMRVCADDGVCDAGDDCVRGNLLDPGPVAEPFRLFEIKVCAAPCSSGGAPCGPLNCDIDGGGNCNAGAGHCLPIEFSTQGCTSNAQCASLPGTICGGEGSCLPPADACTL